MPAYVPFAIATINSGVVRNRNAYAIPEDAYTDMENCYTFRGRLVRRKGAELLGRLRRYFDTISYFDTAASTWNFSLFSISGGVNDVDISGAPTLTITCEGPHGLSNGDQVVFSNVGGTTQLNGNTYTIANVTSTTFDVTQAGPSAYTSGGFWISDRAISNEPNAQVECGSFTLTVDPGGGSEQVITDDGEGNLSGGGITGTINYLTGVVDITAGLNNPFTTTLTYAYFPNLPCMGLNFYETNSTNAETTVAFDTKYSYYYDNGLEAFAPLGYSVWSGDNADFFWTYNYWNNSNGKLLWVTNFNNGTPDPIRYWDSVNWNDLVPQTDNAGTTFLHGCKMLIPYKGRLVALNTYEGAALPAGRTAYPQRARWSQVGNPTITATAWQSDRRGFGGYVDAPTNEHIMSASFIRDLLIVRFERSTWALTYTGNDILPFTWDRISVEMGSDSTFSDVQFDAGILTIGDKGIVTCDGNFVRPIDNDIPDEVFNIHNENDGPIRVHGIRDFYSRLVYWTFPNDDEDGTYPNRMLVYNYEQNTWAFFKDSYTCLGPHWKVEDDTWASIEETWESYTKTWQSGRHQSDFPLTIGGNQQGFVMIITQYQQPVGNESSLYISNLASPTTQYRVTSPSHNLQTGAWVILHDILGTATDEALNGRPFFVEVVDGDTFDLWEKPTRYISAITKATQAVITITGDNIFEAGDDVLITNVAGMTQINGIYTTVISVSGSDVTVDIDSTYFTAYSSGGAIQKINALKEHTKITGGTTSYGGCGTIEILSNFSARSKKFNLLPEGKSSYLGYMDFLVNTTDKGQIVCNIYADYNDSQPVNEDETTFFNSYIDTSLNFISTPKTSKDLKRFFCNLSAAFFQYQLTFDEKIMASLQLNKQEVEIGAVVIYAQKGGRLST